MKKPKKSKTKRVADIKRATKRSKRFKASRKKVAERRRQLTDKRRRERREYEEMMAKFLEARFKGEF